MSRAASTVDTWAANAPERRVHPTISPCWLRRYAANCVQTAGGCFLGKDVASVEQTIIDGEVFFDKKKDLAQRAALASERAELEKADANTAPAPRGGRQGGAPGAPSTTPPENR